MEPLTHTLTGAALAAAGLRRKTPLAATALIVGANLPDVDALTYFMGGYRSLAFRRGWTHGVLAMLVLPLVLTGALWLWDRWVRRPTGAAPVRPGVLALLAALAVATHPILDWLNNYGLRWLMPFDGKWFYGDTLYIVDPWLWLVLGGALFLAHSRSSATLAGWTALAVLMSAVVLVAGPLVPAAVRPIWFVALGLLAAVRVSGWPEQAHSERIVRIALALAVVYVAGLGALERAARAQVARALPAAGISPVEQLMVAPVPADPLAGQVVVTTATAIYTGRFDWLATPKLRMNATAIPRPAATDPVYRAAAAAPEAARFLIWSRFPYVEVEARADGERVVRFFDARYGGAGALAGPAVHLGRDLVPHSAD